MIETAREVFERRVAAWLAEDVDAYLACWHDDMEITMPTGVVRGIDKYRRLVVGSFAWGAPVSFDVHALAVSSAPYAPSRGPSASRTPLRPHADGSLVLSDWTIRARRREDDVLMEWRGLSVCELVDGRITWWREHHLRPPAPVSD